jgi:hypothetical protein
LTLLATKLVVGGKTCENAVDEDKRVKLRKITFHMMDPTKGRVSRRLTYLQTKSKIWRVQEFILLRCSLFCPKCGKEAKQTSSSDTVYVCPNGHEMSPFRVEEDPYLTDRSKGRCVVCSSPILLEDAYCRRCGFRQAEVNKLPEKADSKSQ